MSIFGFPSKNRWLGVRTSPYDCCCKLWKQQMVANTQITNAEVLSYGFSSSGASFILFPPIHFIPLGIETGLSRICQYNNWRCIVKISFLNSKTRKIIHYFGSVRTRHWVWSKTWHILGPCISVNDMLGFSYFLKNTSKEIKINQTDLG